MSDNVPMLFTRPNLTASAHGGAVMPPLDIARYSTRVEVVPIRDEHPLLYFDADLERDHIDAISGNHLVGESIDERARRKRREHVIKLLFWTGALIGCAIFWYAVAMIVAGWVR